MEISLDINAWMETTYEKIIILEMHPNISGLR